MKESNIKQCTACHEYLSPDDFYGRKAECKPCTIERNYTYARRRAKGRRVSKKPLFIINRERMSPGASFRARSARDHRPLEGHLLGEITIIDGNMLPWGMDYEDVLVYMSERRWRVMSRIDRGARVEYETVENSCREPISRETLIGLVSLDQYYLWMDDPRPLTRDEVCDIVDIDRATLDFVLENEYVKVPFSATPQNIKISGTKEPQVPSITEEEQRIAVKEDLDDVEFVEE